LVSTAGLSVINDPVRIREQRQAKKGEITEIDGLTVGLDDLDIE
jgi:hypothetical protein